MSNREKLIELFKTLLNSWAVSPESAADFFLSNGVTVGVEAKPLKQYLTQIDEYAGLKLKFLVFKADTGERIENCFVLRPDKDRAAVEALRAYAEATDNKTLAEDIYNWIGNGVMEQKWIPVSERLPEENGRYLCCTDSPYVETCDFALNLKKVLPDDFRTRNRAGFYSYDSEWGYYERFSITHWMPLPEPPKECE